MDHLQGCVRGRILRLGQDVIAIGLDVIEVAMPQQLLLVWELTPSLRIYHKHNYRIQE